MKAFCVIGLHNTGKTTAVENLIKFFKQKDKSISTIKDIHAENFTMEKQGSNTDRHLKASNSYVFARGLNETHLIWDRQLSFTEMIRHIDTEWLIIEGMKELPLPKIIAARTAEDIEMLLDETVIAITGSYSESHESYKEIPAYNAVRDVDKLYGLLINKVDSQTQIKIKIYFNGVEIPLNDWVSQVSTDLITGFCQNLKGYSPGAKIKIEM